MEIQKKGGLRKTENLTEQHIMNNLYGLFLQSFYKKTCKHTCSFRKSDTWYLIYDRKISRIYICLNLSSYLVVKTLN